MEEVTTSNMDTATQNPNKHEESRTHDIKIKTYYAKQNKSEQDKYVISLISYVEFKKQNS